MTGGLTSHTRSQLDSHNTSIYSFRTISDMQKFHTLITETIPPTANGYTRLLADGEIVISLYLTTFDTAGQVYDASLHEAGHAIDISQSISGAIVSSTATYRAFARNDFLRLDYVSLGTTKATSVPRPNCGTNGALEGVYNPYTSTTLCVGGTLLDPGNRFFHMTNSAIMLEVSNMFKKGDFDGEDWKELHAQMNAYNSYAVGQIGTPSNLLDRPSHQLFANGFFECALSWNTAEINNFSLPPSVPSYCTNLLPSWYEPFDTL